MGLEQAQELPVDDEMPPEAIEAGIPAEIWKLAHGYGDNGFKTSDQVLREKLPPDIYESYKRLLAGNSVSEIDPESKADTQDMMQPSGPRTLLPIAAEYRDKLREQSRPQSETSDDKTA